MSERRVRAGGRSASGDREVLEGPLRARAWTSWCARQMSSMPLVSLNSDVALEPKSHPAPRGLWTRGP